MSGNDGKVIVYHREHRNEHEDVIFRIPLDEDGISISLTTFQQLLALSIGVSSGAIKASQYREAMEQALKYYEIDEE